jgi:hypothetical protein
VARSNVSPAASAGPIDLIRVPNGGIQPEAVVDSAGNVHLVYLAGELRAADVFYTRSRERPVSDPATGVCGCCALRLFCRARR